MEKGKKFTVQFEVEMDEVQSVQQIQDMVFNNLTDVTTLSNIKIKLEKQESIWRTG